eukprot:g1090.t1
MVVFSVCGFGAPPYHLCSRPVRRGRKPARLRASTSNSPSHTNVDSDKEKLTKASTSSRNTAVTAQWNSLMRWSNACKIHNGTGELEKVTKVVVLGGGSFGTAMSVVLARKKASLKVQMLLRDQELVRDINEGHCNTKYLKNYQLPVNVYATVDKAEAIKDAEYAIHAVPVQHSRLFLHSIQRHLPMEVPVISVSKGMEVGTGEMMSAIIQSVLGKRKPAAFISGPSFAKEMIEGCPTSLVAASKDKKLARKVQELFACQYIRVNSTRDVQGVEVCGATKNVLAIAAGIVEGLGLGHNAMAGLIAQGCREIRWIATKMGARAETIAGLAGIGDIMLTCYGDLSRNRTVGVRLGQGESIHEILAGMSQVAEGVTTAAVVVSLARKYKVRLPVLTAVAQVIDGNLSSLDAVAAIMTLPQIDEK